MTLAGFRPPCIPSAEELRQDLPAIGEGLDAQFHELHARPTPERLHALTLYLDGARARLVQYAWALANEGRDDAG